MFTVCLALRSVRTRHVPLRSVRTRHVLPRSVMHSDADLQLFNTATRTPSVFTAPQTITGLMLVH